jgi:hypothetical protein
VIIENKVGASGNLGMAEGARAAPDGYTLVLAPAGNLTVNPLLFSKLTVATTPWTPIPLVVAAPDVDANAVARLRARLVTIHDIAVYRPLLADVLLARFVKPDTRSYAALEAMADFAAERGYDAIR